MVIVVWVRLVLPGRPPPAMGSCGAGLLEYVALLFMVVTTVDRRPPWGALITWIGEHPAGGGCAVKMDPAPAFLSSLGCLPLMGAPAGQVRAGPPELVGLMVAVVLSSSTIWLEVRVLRSYAAAWLSLVEASVS